MAPDAIQTDDRGVHVIDEHDVGQAISATKERVFKHCDYQEDSRYQRQTNDLQDFLVNSPENQWEHLCRCSFLAC